MGKKNSWAEAAWVVKQLKGNIGPTPVEPNNLTEMSVEQTTYDFTLEIKYAWPQNITEGDTISIVESVKVVVYEEGQDTNDINGGIYNNTSTVKDEYKETPLRVPNTYFTGGKTYTVHFYPISDQGLINKNTANAKSFVAKSKRQLAPSDLPEKSVEQDNKFDVKIKYAWPANINTTTTTCTVSSVKIVIYREGQDSNDENGGFYNHTSTTRDEHKTNPLTISRDNFDYGKTYTIHFYPISDQGLINKNTTNTITFTSKEKTQMPPDDLPELMVLPSDESDDFAVLVNYKWPDNVNTFTTTCTVSSVKMVIYEGKVGDSLGDGVGIYNNTSTTRDEYLNTPLTIDKSHFKPNTDYTLRWFITSSAGLVNENIENFQYFRTSDMITVVKFGYRININDSNPDTRVEYLSDCDNASYTPAHMDFSTGKFDYGSWGDAWFIKGCKPCLLRPNGTVEVYLDPNDYTKSVDGKTLSSVWYYDNDGNEINVMVEIPLVWLKTERDSSNNYIYCYISNKQIDSTYTAYAHTNELDEIIDKIYIGAYNGIYNGNKTSPKVLSTRLDINSNYVHAISDNSVTLELYLDICHNNNPYNKHIWETNTLSDLILINHLLILMGKSTNGQKVFGTGHTASRIDPGTMDKKGLFYGINYNSATEGVKVFGIEHWWGNTGRYIAGLAVIKRPGLQFWNIKAKLTYKGMFTDGYITRGTNAQLVEDEYEIAYSINGAMAGYLNEVELERDVPGFLCPKELSGTSSTYYCDYVALPAISYEDRVMSFFYGGGVDYTSTSYSSNLGPFHLRHAYIGNGLSQYTGFSLSCKPI